MTDCNTLAPARWPGLMVLAGAGLCLLAPTWTFAQQGSAPAAASAPVAAPLVPVAPAVTVTTGSVDLAEFLRAVSQHSLDLQAQRETVTSAQAGVSIAGVSPDPQLTAGIAAKELYGPNKPNAATATTLGLAYTLELGGKRAQRLRSASSNVRVSETGLALFTRQLQATAAAAFVEVCRTRGALRHQESSLRAMQELVRGNEARLRVGDIGRLELAQSRVEAERFAADVTRARADAQGAELTLPALLGQDYAVAFGQRALQCQFKRVRLETALDTLLAQALAGRDDVKLARAMLDNARDNLELAQANRWVDPTINLGVTNTPRVNPVVDAGGNVTNSPAERSQALTLTFTVPLPFSRAQKGELQQAQALLTQAELQLQSSLLKAQGDVRATHVQYAAAADNLDRYLGHVLVDADQVLEGVRTSYRKGAASLLDLLSAQRTSDEVHQAHLQAVADLANATAKLQISLGWAPEF